MTSLAKNDAYTEAFLQAERGMNGEANSFVHAIRRRGLQAYQELGLPTTKLEDFKYTNLAQLNEFSSLSPRPPAGEGSRVRVASFGGRPKEFTICNLSHAFATHARLLQNHLAKHALPSTDGLVALNTAFLFDGIFIYVPKGVVVEKPVEITLPINETTQPSMQCARVLVFLEDGAQLDLIETHTSTNQAPVVSNVVSEIILGDNAVMRHMTLQNNSLSTITLRHQSVYQAKNSQLTSSTLSLGSSLARHSSDILLAGEGARCNLTGLDLGKSTQHVDTCVKVAHRAKSCQSLQQFRTILDDKASGVFNGRVVVSTGADKTAASQNNRNLLLSDNAVMNTRPQLEIYADDVKCTHGATVGQLDEAAIFYLRSRGLDKKQARQMMTTAFAEEILSQVWHNESKAEWQEHMQRWLTR